MMSTDLNDPTYYIRRAKLKNDRVFGTQILTEWSGYELLGIRNKPEGTNLGIDLDYLSKRGFGYGAAFTYNRDDVFGWGNHARGLDKLLGASQDSGLDNLGQAPPCPRTRKVVRYRLFGQHRQELPYDLQLSAELGWISDRNFLEEYYKSEWEELKDENTGVELKRIVGNHSWSLSADYGLNDFFTHTDSIRGDLFGVGKTLVNDTFTWFHHSSLEYAKFDKLDAPTNPNDQPFSFLPWEEYSREGERGPHRGTKSIGRSNSARSRWCPI